MGDNHKTSGWSNWGSRLLNIKKSISNRTPSLKLWGLCLIMHAAFASQADAFDGSIAEERDFGSCIISSISFTSIENGGIVVSTGVSTFTAGGAVWLFGSSTPFDGPVDATVLSGCVAGSSPSEFTNIVQDGADAISYAAETSASLSFDFRDISFSYSLTGAVGTTASASPSITDFTVPTVTSVAVPADGSYGAGQNLDFTVNFSENVIVAGPALVVIAIDMQTYPAAYVSGSGTNSLLFRYTVQPGENDPDGIEVGSLASGVGAIKDADGFDADLTLNGLGSTASVLVDTIAPTVTIGTVIPTAPGVFTASITLSEPASGNLFEEADVTVNNTTASLTGSGTNFTVTLRPISEGFFEFGVLGGAFTDAAGNDNISSAGVSAFYDGTPPTITLGPLTDTGAGIYTSAITLSEPTGISNLFEQADLTVGNGTATLTGSGTSFVATITPAGVGVVTLDVAAGAFTDPGLNVNAAATQVSVLFDNVAPTVSIGTLIPTAPGVFTADITLSEPASGNLFEEADITVVNTTATLSGSGTNFTVTLRPISEGPFLFGVLGGAFTDAAGNDNIASAGVSSTFDATPPTITLGPLTDTGSNTYTSAITLSEPAGAFGNPFEQADLIVGNGSATLTGSGTNFVATITPAGVGLVTLDVPAGAFSDRGLNDNIAATQVSVLFDNVAPTITLGPLTDTGSGTYTSVITLSEPAFGNQLDQADLNVGNGSATLSGFSTSFIATITPASGGLVTLDVAAGAFSDIAGNASIAATQVSVLFDNVAPTITLGPLTDTGSDTYTSAITLSEPASGNLFEQGDLTVGNGSATLAGSGTSFTATITPASGGLVTLDVAAAAFTDAVGNDNTAATQVSTLFDNVAPTITLGALTDMGSGTYTSAITLSEASTDFELADLTLVNSTATLSGSGTDYTVTLTPAGDGLVSVTVAASSFSDSAGNQNAVASNTVSATFDGTAPNLIITGVPASVSGPFTATFTFSEVVVGFEFGDITVSNATPSSFAGSGAVYTAVITPLLAGTVIVDVNAAVAQDLAGNNNEAARVTGEYEPIQPTVVLSGLPETFVGQETVAVVISFSEPVSGFSAADISVSNGSVSQLNGSGTSYSAIISPTVAGDLTVFVPERVAVSATGAWNTASNVMRSENLTINETQKLIADFITTRANQLVSNQPDLTPFLLGGTGSGFNAQATRGALNFALVSQPDRQVWYQLQASRTDAVGTTNDYLFGAIGSHRKIGENTLLGAILEYDHGSRSEGASRISGSGWLVGPYFVTRLPNQPLYFEGRLLWGKTHNRISPFGTYTDSFSTERALVNFKVSGQMIHGETTLIPSLGASYTTDRQNPYTDSLGNAIPEQEIQLGQLALGLDLSTPFKFGNQTWKLDAGIRGLYTTTKGNGTPSLVASSVDGARARINVKASNKLKNGGHFFVGGHYDGIGVKDFEGFGVELGMEVKF
jgi:hypothetical protein